MKVALVLPAGTVTLAGTVAAAVLLLFSVTTARPRALPHSMSPCRWKASRDHRRWTQTSQTTPKSGATVIVTVATLEDTPAAFAVYVKLSVPVKLDAGV